MTKVKMFDAEPDFLESPDGLIIKKTQLITPDLLQETKDASYRTGPEGDFMHVATIPTLVVEQWKREGFDIFTASAREIMKKLSQDNLGAFRATRKRV